MPIEHATPQQSAPSARLAIWLIALLPAVLALTTWDSDGRLTLSGYQLRHYSLPVTMIELLVVWLATRTGWQLRRSFNDLSPFARVLLVSWATLALFAALLLSDQIGVSLFVTFRYLLHGLFFAAAIHFFRIAHTQDAPTLLAAISVGAIFYIGILSIFALLVSDVDSFPWTTRIPSGTNIRQIGYYVAIMSVAPLAMMLFAEDRKVWSYCLCFAALISFIAWSGSRAALFGIVVGGTLACLAIWQTPQWKRIILMSACVTIGLGASITIPNPSPEFGLLRIFSASASGRDASSGRTLVWRRTVDEIQASPFLGHGAGTFRANMERKYRFVFNHPHQFILQYIYDWGLVGAALFLTLLGLLARSTVFKSRGASSVTGYAATTGALTTVIIGMIDGALFSPLSIVMMLTMLAPLFAVQTTAPQQR